MSKKTISVHNHKCTTACAHRDICYLVNGSHFDTTEKECAAEPNRIEELIEKISGDYDVHYSGCDFVASFFTYATFIYGNERHKHMTFSCREYNKMLGMVGIKNKIEFDKNIQLTVYNLEQIRQFEYKNIQKLYLIKDEDSYETAISILKDSSDIRKLHFPIAHQWAEENKDKLLLLVGFWNMCEDDTISLDSCLENYVLHGKCVYSENYIDLRYDGSVRRCPFSDEYHKTNYDNPDSMFEIEFRPTCVFGELFGREEWRNGNSQK